MYLWYLTEDLVSLAFFCDDVSTERKKAMADALEKPSKPKAAKKTGRQRVDQEISSPNSKLTAFLELPPEDWAALPEYQTAKKTVASLRVVNDTAERGVSDICRYSPKTRHSFDS